jgi:hypothetical protein
MKKTIALALFLTSSAALAQSKHWFGLCDPGSHCGRCDEQSEFHLKAEASRGVVTFTGHSPDGIPQMKEMVDCQFKDSQNWVCRDGRALMTSVEGKVNIQFLGPAVAGKELCFK